MERCQCQTGNKKQCVRDAKSGSEFCCQHQNCQTVQKYSLTKNERQYISEMNDVLVDSIVGDENGILIEDFHYKKSNSTLHAKILMPYLHDLDGLKKSIQEIYIDYGLLDNFDQLNESDQRKDKF